LFNNFFYRPFTKNLTRRMKTQKFYLLTLFLAMAAAFTGCKKDEDAKPAMTIKSVTPASGVIGTEITLVGTGFEKGATVTIGNIVATISAVVSGSEATAVVPEGVPTGVSSTVIVKNSDGRQASLSAAFTVVEQPTISGVTPNEGSVSTELTITGTNFATDATVLIGGIAAATVEVASTTTIYVSVPEGIAANTLLPVTVQNPNNGGDVTFADAFTAINPVLSFVNSATKPSGNVSSTVILEGKAFGDLQGSGQVLFSDGAGGTIAATIASAEDWTDTFIVTTVPSGAEDGPVVVVTAIGTSNSLPFTVTDAATFSPSTINWTVTTALPLAVSGHPAAHVPVDDATGLTNQFVHVSGGRIGDGTASDQYVFGQINADGTIASWIATTSLPSARAFHASVAATPFNSKASGSGFVYVLGGIDGTGEVISNVSMAALNNDGTIQTWASTTALPQPLYATGAVIFRGSIYVAGGATVGGTPVSAVYRATIRVDGQLNAWETLPALPVSIAHHGLVTFGGYLYAVGGETAVADPDDDAQVTATGGVYYSKINLRTGVSGDWVLNASALGKERSKHTALVLGGSMFVSSGIYSGLSASVQGSSENIYATINSDGSIANFNGATGSNTLYSAGGSNLFNQAGISYIDANGVAHVMIIGGAKVGAPTTKIANVLFY
jgi:hypothetical protein